MRIICVVGLILCCGLEVVLGATTFCTNIADANLKYTCILSNAENAIVNEQITIPTGQQYTDVLRVQVPTKASEQIISALNIAFVNLEELEIPFGNVLALQASSASLGSATTNGARLKKIQISNSDFNTWPSRAFDRCVLLTDLNLSRNRIATIDTAALVGLTELLTLNLADNAVPYTSPLFSNTIVTKLTLFNISGNGLTSLPAAFPSAASLQKIDLSRNKISTIGVDYFNTFTNLQELSLAQNSLTTLNNNLFGSLVNLMLLNVASNKFTNFEFLKAATKLQTLNISDTGLVQFSDSFLTGNVELKRLYASHNNLADLSTSSFTKQVDNLELLDVSNNRINSVDSDFFTSVKNLKAVNFACNRCISQNFLTKPADISKQFEVCKSSSIIISTALMMISAFIVKFF